MTGLYVYRLIGNASQLTFIFFRGVETANQMENGPFRVDLPLENDDLHGND